MEQPPDPAAFAALFDEHYPRLHRWLHRRVGRALADDLAQQTFIEALRGAGRYRAGPAGPGPWLFGIASNLVRAHRRQEERRLRAYARTGVDPVGQLDVDAIADRVDAGLAGPRLAAALAALRPGDRDVLLLTAWAGFGSAEIAEALGIPVGTVRSRLHRARAKVRAVLDNPRDAAPARSGRLEVHDERP